MNSDIFLSFIVPVYNSENTLSNCLDSILNQTPRNFEIIIVNDGSTDNSQTIIDKYAESFPNIMKSYTKENGGPGDTRNFGIKKSNGRYIAFVDSDDTISSNYLAVVKSIIDRHNSDMVIISYNRIYNRTQHLFERFHKFNKWDVYDIPFDIDTMPEVICNIEVASWLKITKREMFFQDEHLFYSYSSIAEDLEASLKWYLNVHNIYVTKEKLYNYAITSNTLNLNSKNIEQFIEIIESVCEYYKNLGKFELYYPELEYLFAKHMLISNILRLKASKHKKNFGIFMSLRKAMIHNFPRYTKNIHFKTDPMYLRIAIIISYYFPKLFYFILLPI